MSTTTSDALSQRRPSDMPAGFPEFYNQVGPQETYVILGSQGSGTNLLSKILRHVFGFSVVHDRSLIFNAALAVGPNPSPRTIRRQMRYVHSRLFPGPVAKRLRSKHYHHQAKNYLEIERYFDAVPIRSASDFASFFYTYHAWVNGCRHKAIKSDDLWESISHIDEVLPDRRYILLVRDPRDNALSIVNKDFGPQNLHAASWYVKRRLQAYRAEIERHPEQSLVSRYETLLNEPMQFVEAFQAQFGVSPVDEAADAIRQIGIRSTNFNKWKQLSVRCRKTCEWVLRDEIDSFGYEPGNSRSPISTSEAFGSQAHDVLARIPQKLSRIGRNLIHP